MLLSLVSRPDRSIRICPLQSHFRSIRIQGHCSIGPTPASGSADAATKTPTMLHLPPEVKRQLEAAAAAAAGVSQSVYAMQVLQAHFKRKGIE
jgi:hypothetical protein